MVLEFLSGEPAKDIMDYLRKALHLPLHTIHYNLASTLENFYAELKIQIHKPPLRDRVRWDCIFDEMWATMGARVSARREGDHQTIRPRRGQPRLGRPLHLYFFATVSSSIISLTEFLLFPDSSISCPSSVSGTRTMVSANGAIPPAGQAPERPAVDGSPR